MTPDAVMRILGIWLCMPSLNAAVRIDMPDNKNPVSITAEGSEPTAVSDNYSIPLGKLIERCLPPPSEVNISGQRRHLYDKRFNGGALLDVADLELEWTRDITEHLKLEKRTLKLFRTAGFCYYSNYCSALYVLCSYFHVLGGGVYGILANNYFNTEIEKHNVQRHNLLKPSL